MSLSEERWSASSARVAAGDAGLDGLDDGERGPVGLGCGAGVVDRRGSRDGCRSREADFTCGVTVRARGLPSSGRISRPACRGCPTRCATHRRSIDGPDCREMPAGSIHGGVRNRGIFATSRRSLSGGRGRSRTARCRRRRRRSATPPTPLIGIAASVSQASRTSRDSPAPSLPTTSTSGPARPRPGRRCRCRRLAVQPDQDAAGVGVRPQRPVEVGGPGDRQPRGGAGRGLPGRGGHPGRAALRDQHAVGAERGRRADDRAQVARVGDRVQRHDQRPASGVQRRRRAGRRGGRTRTPAAAGPRPGAPPRRSAGRARPG